MTVRGKLATAFWVGLLLAEVLIIVWVFYWGLTFSGVHWGIGY